MRTTAKFRTFGLTFALLGLSGCATGPHAPVVCLESDRPAEASINQDAGRGNPIFVTLRLGSGEELPFMVDTGVPITMFDQSLEPKLGRRVGSSAVEFLGGATHSGGLYVPPPLYLGNTLLRTAWMARFQTNVVATADLQPMASRLHHPVLGILGIDCLRRYCIQIDFQGAKLRFLNPAGLKAAALGQRFALTYDAQGCPRLSGGALLASNNDSAMLDTGYYIGDGALEPGLLQEARQRKSAAGTGPVQFLGANLTFFPSCVWSGGTYTNLLLGEEGNILGLRFLARHLVTLDFRHDKMYLRRTTPGPPAGDWYLEIQSKSDSARDFLAGLLKKGRLPGADMGGEFEFQHQSNSGTFHLRKEGDPSVYHYTVAAPARSSAWKVQRAWRTDRDGRTIEEYPVPEDSR